MIETENLTERIFGNNSDMVVLTKIRAKIESQPEELGFRNVYKIFTK